RSRRAESAGFAARHEKRTVVYQKRNAYALVLRRHDIVLNKSIEQRECGRRVLASASQVAHLSIRHDDHALQAVAIAARECAESARKIVMQDQIPSSENLRREKVGKAFVIRRLIPAGSNQILDVAVENEHRRGSRKIKMRKPRRPLRIPLRH